ncbi:hypothetical protein BBP40_005982 [Aspergillus hancockii]|nr:hypothetical protein BBP40_005982 [Aspergillus hancockii]
MGHSTYFGYYSTKPAKLYLLHYPSCHRTPHNALHGEFLPDIYFASCKMQRSARTYPRFCGTAIDLTVLKDIHIPAVILGIVRWTCENDPVKFVQVRIDGMFNHDLRAVGNCCANLSPKRNKRETNELQFSGTISSRWEI